MIAFILILPRLEGLINTSFLRYMRVAYPFVFLTYFYTETDALNNIFFNDLDYYFARIDGLIFNFQPSLNFSQWFPQAWFSEIMNLGYFSYYFLILAFTIYIFIKNRSDFERNTFIIVTSFLTYYLLFVIIPVGGPQYYFKPPYNSIPHSGIFRTLVTTVECIGERPTAAFPSSHVGVVAILNILAWKKYSKTLLWIIPFSVILILSTVYIKAHYAIDVMGGFLSAPLILFFGIFLWKKIGKKIPTH